MTAPADLAELARTHPEAAIVVDEAYVEFGGESVVPWLAELPNLIVVRTMSKAFGFASLRVGFAVAAPESAAVLEASGATAPIAGPAARIASGSAARPTFRPRLDNRRARADARRTCRGRLGRSTRGRQLRLAPRSPEPLGERLEEQGLIVRRFSQGIRITLRHPAENDILLRALVPAEARRGAGRRL